MTDDTVFEDINEAKADLHHIYNEPDPRAYFRELRKLGYAIPGAAKPIFRKLIEVLGRRQDDPVRVLDLGCSYGVNAALLKHDLSMDALYDHWGHKRFDDASPDEVAEYDRQYFASLDGGEDIEVIGLDQSRNAIAFAEEAGLLDDGLAVDLETAPLPDGARDDLTPVDLVTSTGCVGYVTDKTFDRLLPAVTSGRPSWLANFVLRMFPFEDIARTLDARGYVTEKLAGRTFVQRRFVSADEQDQVLAQLREQGVDPTGKEADGHLHAEFFLSRPRSDAEKLPLNRLLAA